MKAWTLTAPNTLKQIVADPTHPDKFNNVKVKIEELLLSSTDLNFYKGTAKQKAPTILGRFAVGVVSEVAENEKVLLKKMDRVVIEPYLPCFACESCVKGEYADCENLVTLGYDEDGLLRNFVDLPSAILHKLPQAISNDVALFTPYVALGLNIVNSMNVEPGRHVAVFASSKVGLIVAELLAYYQALPILISDNDELLNMAKAQGIFYTFHSGGASDFEREVQIITGGRMCKSVVYFSESNFSLKDAVNIASFNGKICLAGNVFKDSKISAQQIVAKHLTVYGIYNGCGSFASAINLLVTGKINVSAMIGNKLNFDTLDQNIGKIDASALPTKANVIVVD